MAQGYTIELWNGKYDEGAEFIVRDNSNNKMTYFKPGATKNLTWATADLTKDPEAKGWGDFGGEQVDNLEDVVF